MRIVYVAGWLRSGTTLLSRMLGSIPGALAIGELSGVWGAAARGEICSCGRVIVDCPVWSSGFRAVEASHLIRPTDFREFALLTSSVLRTRRSSRLAALRGVPSDRWPADVRTYVSVISTLLEAIRAESQSDVLVDSSKLPPGFLTLSLVRDAQVDVVQIIRDPRAVVSSELTSSRRQASGAASPPGRSLLRSSLYWSVANVAVQRLGQAADSYTMVRYEDLAARPTERLRWLTRRLELAEPTQEVLHLGHLAVGNPSRFDSSPPVRPDLSWQTELSPLQRSLVSTVSAPARAVLRRRTERAH